MGPFPFMDIFCEHTFCADSGSLNLAFLFLFFNFLRLNTSIFTGAVQRCVKPSGKQAKLQRSNYNLGHNSISVRC